jgi:hypothetical protein
MYPLMRQDLQIKSRKSKPKSKMKLTADIPGESGSEVCKVNDEMELVANVTSGPHSDRNGATS